MRYRRSMAFSPGKANAAAPSVSGDTAPPGAVALLPAGSLSNTDALIIPSVTLTSGPIGAVASTIYNGLMVGSVG